MADVEPEETTELIVTESELDIIGKALKAYFLSAPLDDLTKITRLGMFIDDCKKDLGW